MNEENNNETMPKLKENNSPTSLAKGYTGNLGNNKNQENTPNVNNNMPNVNSIKGKLGNNNNKGKENEATNNKGEDIANNPNQKGAKEGGTKKAIKTLGRGAAKAANAVTGGKADKVVNKVANSRIGNKLVGVVSDKLDKIPGVKKATDDLDKSGATDAANDAMDAVEEAKKGDVKGAVNSVKSLGKNLLTLKKFVKRKAILMFLLPLLPAIFIIALVIIVVVVIMGPTIGGELDLIENGEDQAETCAIGDDYVQYAISMAENDEVGYSQPHRYYTDNGNGILDVDCSSMVWYALKNTGYDVGSSAFATGSMKSILTAAGFTFHDYTSESELQYGDILWYHYSSDKGHTEIYIGDGQNVGAHGCEGSGQSCSAGDQNGTEVSVGNGKNDTRGWMGYFRPSEIMTECGGTVTGVDAFMMALEYYNSVLTSDTEHTWIYSNTNYYVYQSGSGSTFDKMLSYGDTSGHYRGANCAAIVHWALKDLGVIPDDYILFGSKKAHGLIYNYHTYNSSGESSDGKLKSYIDEAMDVIDTGGKTFTTLVNDGTLQRGDICILAGHTFVYAGDGMVYDAGRKSNTKNTTDSSINMSKDGTYGSNTSAYVFHSFYEAASSYDKGNAITYIIRFKDGYYPETYRTSSGEIVENQESDTSESTGDYVVDVTEEEIDDMMRIVWMENGSSGGSYDLQYYTACVMVNRLLDGIPSKYSSMHDVLSSSGQYATWSKETDWDGNSWESIKDSDKTEKTREAVYDALTNPDRNVHYQDSRSNHYGKTVYYEEYVASTGTTEYIYY